MLQLKKWVQPLFVVCMLFVAVQIGDGGINLSIVWQDDL